MTTKTPEELAQFLAIRADNIQRLVDALGGLREHGGPVVDVEIRERMVNIPPGTKVIDVWITDANDRALAYLLTTLHPERLELKTCIYDAPRLDYLDDPRPMLDDNPQIDLTSI